ncbi:alpha-E domain-containing protein [Ketogulonicigenium vulgare]|uniref:DUF403 domain-containing protein n=1 Tax=Ketogulonicigenium vulgare (strain WSH-001) TaxID=759362 RepID=F9Y7A3_KETVW|nr:alpha-E domain-containing protein [Ketogulonicigenium vulgare]ADO42845.1 conserved hypothetical protein [Ketogulonicigenium vulgare Y25]AEM41031.1 hypothetical protein KVU_1192 [Ketogulonicigenium vulgare WSH-001]ALJ81180.1 A alpha-helical domain with a conserved ER moti [Ketogulonicigenium vulgare]ANW33924.1 A alpha-helical domain with a conserved ER moti [Ketogulonicigenium vulgare]AOZ54758.1 hypothetical protein KVC_1745 [Ketogulonicigenium vulgare]
MLGKTAGGLYWMFRYLERSENTARMIAAGMRLALTSPDGDEEWSSILQSATMDWGYQQKYGTSITRATAVDWMLRDRENPSSVINVVEGARNNARLVRTALTREVWEAVNQTWMLLRDLLKSHVKESDLPYVLQVIRQQSAYVRGAVSGTMLRNDIHNFIRLGTFIERADNTARIIDVKYFVLLPNASAVGSTLDNVQWDSILRILSGEGGYRLTYGQDPRPREIAQFLILDRRMPRSLAYCGAVLASNMQHLARDYDQRVHSHALIEALSVTHLSRGVDEIFEFGLHEFLQDFMGFIAEISAQIEVDYRFYE